MIRKKLHTYIFRTKWGDIRFSLPQATCEESLEFYDMIKRNNTVEIMWYVKRMLKECWELNIRSWFWISFLNKKRVVYTFFSKYVDFLQVLSKLIHKPYKSKYDGIKIFTWKEKRPSCVWSEMLIMSKKTRIPVDQLLDRLTLEEWGIYYDAILHENLEMDKKTQKFNDQAERIGKWWLTNEEMKSKLKKDREFLRSATKHKVISQWKL